MEGIIIKAISGFYYVKTEAGIFECKARGVFRKENISPIVGDRVVFSKTNEDKGIVEEILPRKNCLVRPLIANLDKLFIVSAYENPAPNALLIDRLIAICEMAEIEPVLIFNKSDLGDFSGWASIYKNAGFKVYTVSCKSGENVEEIKSEFKNCTCAFAGNSGVGKSSILSRLLPEISFATGEVSRKLGRGRHTTRTVELFVNSYGGLVADTPGFASVENDKFDLSFKENLPFLFREFVPFLNGCRFTGCSHTAEKGCAVIEAVENGKISKSRFESYVALYNEVKDLKPWEAKRKN
ncbi:MAG: ribosome small subunit-dependent GTPase A [Clostridia bacterium]|nr:ribosome small subunit-dependent GTPase A [Clostridia bacterium]